MDVGRFEGPNSARACRAPTVFPQRIGGGSCCGVSNNQRFGIGLGAQEQADLVAFLRTL
jgi:hypothetical protein